MAMSVIQTDRVFSAAEATASPISPNIFSNRTPLNIGAAQIAAKLQRRFITPGLLSALARMADCTLLAVAGAAILWVYVGPPEESGTAIVLASVLLPLAATILIGSFNGYTVSAYRRLVADLRRVVTA